MLVILLILALWLMSMLFRRDGFTGGDETAPVLFKYYSDLTRGIPYSSNYSQCELKHNGQVKLLLTELEFLSECLPAADSRAVFIYAGSAPSNKISFLAGLFPNVKFVLVDPNEHFVYFDNGNQYMDQHIDQFCYFRIGELGGVGPGSKMRKVTKITAGC